MKPSLAFIKQWSKREKMVFGVTCLIVGLVVTDQLIVRPIIRVFQSLDREAGDLKTNVRKSMRLLSQKKNILSQQKTLESCAVKGKSPEEETVALLKLIEDLANQASVNVLYIKPASVKTEDVGKKYYIVLQCEGKMEQLITFFHKVEGSNQLLRIEKYEIEPAEKGSSVAKTHVRISKTVV